MRKRRELFVYLGLNCCIAGMMKAGLGGHTISAILDVMKTFLLVFRNFLSCIVVDGA